MCMFNKLSAGLLAAFLLFSGCGLLGDDPNITRYEATLSGSNIVPDPVSTEATGEAWFRLNQKDNEIEYRLELANIEDVTQAHIHLGRSSENGPVIVPLLSLTQNADGTGLGSPRSFDDQQVVARGILRSGDIEANSEQAFEGRFSDLVEAFQDENAYVNVHTERHPAGALRGAIVPEEDD